MNILKSIMSSESTPTIIESLYDSINTLSLTTNLKLCLDSGDSVSYDPAVQTVSWLDVSGSGYNFWRGNTVGASSDEPTFNGSAGGLSSSDYWRLDGGDLFSSANRSTFPTWISGMHKNNALFTFLCTFYMTASTSRVGMFLTGSALTVNNANGVIMSTDTNRKFVFSVRGTSGAVFFLTSTTSFNANSWNVVQFSVDEANGTYILNINGAEESGSCTYTTPGTGDAFAYPRLGISGYAANAPNTFSPDGTRFSEMAIFSEALTSTNLSDIYNRIRGRFGI